MSFQFLVVPQWQGSSSTRALLLQDGAEAIKSDLPASNTKQVQVPIGAGESLGTGIRRFSAIQSVRDKFAEQLAEITEPVITIGGDCGCELAAIEHAMRRHPGRLALVWIDAHPDLNSPENSPSGAFHGMVLRAILDDIGPLSIQTPLETPKVVLVGVRSFDDAELEWAEAHQLARLEVEQFSATNLIELLSRTGCSSVYLHIDLDVLDPSEFNSVSFPEPFGLRVQDLIETIREVRRNFELAGAGICEFAPPDSSAAEGDLPTILRIIGALTSKVDKSPN